MHPAISVNCFCIFSIGAVGIDMLRIVLPSLFLGHALRTSGVCLEATALRVTSLKPDNKKYSSDNHDYGDEPNDSLPQFPLESRVSDVLPLDLIRQTSLTYFQPPAMEVGIINSLFAFLKAATADI
jgi:hypothetical protein